MDEHLELMWWRGSGIVVTEVDERNKSKIQIYCPELCPVLQGKIEDKPEEETVSMTGTDEIPQKPVKIKLTTNIYAEYLGDAHGASVPDVVPGEQVMVHRHRGDDRFFWIPYRNNDHYRQVEHYRISCMNKEHQDPESEDETYFLEIDTKYVKGIRMKTSDKMDEDFVYLWEIDPVNNTYVLQDNVGNFIQLHSDKPDGQTQSITLRNNRGTYAKLISDFIYANAPKDIVGNAGNDINVTAGNNINAYAEVGIYAYAGETIYGQAEKSATVKAPSITLDGNVTITGTLNTGGVATFPNHGPH